MRFHEKNEEEFVKVFEELETVAVDDVVELKKEFCNAFAVVCPSKVAFIKQTVKSN